VVLKYPPLFYLYASHDKGGFGKLMFLMWFALFHGFFLSSWTQVLPFFPCIPPFFRVSTVEKANLKWLIQVEGPQFQQTIGKNFFYQNTFIISA
jgi:hypothetical protein